MHLQLALPEAELRKIIREEIGTQIRDILAKEFEGLVKGEIAKMRLMKPKSPALGLAVERSVKRRVAALSRDNVAQNVHVLKTVVNRLYSEAIVDARRYFKDDISFHREQLTDEIKRLNAAVKKKKLAANA